MNIYLIRHTAVYNPNKLCYGQSEIPLEENFTVDFDWIKDRLNTDENTAFWSSPFRRCTKLAAYLSDDNFTTDARISELNFGDWEMKAWSEIDSTELNPWMEDFVNYTPTNGESFNDLYNRCTDFFEEITQNATTDAVVVCHAGLIKAILAYILDYPLENAFNLQIDYASITKVYWDTKNKITKVEYSNLNPQNFKIPVKD
jgi:alpha-ribazole phosphatase